MYYFVKRVETSKETREQKTWYVGKQDSWFAENELSGHSVRKYGFYTEAAAKRSSAFRNQSSDSCIVCDSVSIVKLSIT